MNETTQLDHKAFLSSLTKEQRQDLTGKSNVRSGLALVVHLSAIALVSTMIILRVPFWPALLILQGILLIFLFTLMHECIHRTVFTNAWVNDAVAYSCGLILFLPATWFRYFHFAHHRHTQDPKYDPELESEKPKTRWAYVKHVSGLPTWISQLSALGRNAAGNFSYHFVLPSKVKSISLEAQIMLVIYLLAFVTLTFNGLVKEAIVLWIIPLLLGQPFLRIYLLAEHGHCPFVANMFENTRTTFTNRLVRRLAWNMPYHAEHHAMPTVPFHKLPELHALAQKHLKTTSDGYVDFNRDFVENL